MTRVHRLLASARLQPADPFLVAHATGLLLEEVWAELRRYGVEVSKPDGTSRWSIEFPGDDQLAPRITVSAKLGAVGLEGWRTLPSLIEHESVEQELLLAELVYDPATRRLIAPADPEGSALYAVISGILRAAGRVPPSGPFSPDDISADRLLSRTFDISSPQQGEAAAVFALIDRAVRLLADRRFEVTRPSPTFPRWTLSREPSPGTRWTLLIPVPTDARKITAAVSESRDGVPTGPTRRLVLTELFYDPATNHLRPRGLVKGSALDVLLRGMLGAVGCNTKEPERE